MKFLKNLFQTEREKEPAVLVNWEDLRGLDELNVLQDNSFHHPQVIFKHSTICSISSWVMRSFEKDENHPESGVTYYLLDLITYRDISNAIAENYGVRHESPQVLVVKDGQVVAHASHHSIESIDLNEFI